MTDIEVFQELILETAKVPLISVGQKKKVILTEPQHSKSSATIFGLPEDVIVIKADAFTSPSSVFIGSRGECKRSDYIIVADRKKVILCIEMKSSKGNNAEIIQQLKGALCFSVYCREIGRSFWNRNDFLQGFKFRFVSICHTSIPKQKTRIDRSSGNHDHPNRMMKINYPNHIEFNHLSGA